MKIEIDIIDRIYYNIEDFCAANGKDIAEYMADIVIERYNIDKYGDLNEKINHNIQEKKVKQRKAEKKSTVSTNVDNETHIVEVIKEEKTEIIKTEENISKKTDNAEISSEKPKHTKRTLKSK